MTSLPGPRIVSDQIVLDLDASNVQKSMPFGVARLNLMKNPSVETAISYYVADAGIGRTCTVERSSDMSFSGSFSAKYIPKTGKGTTGNRFIASIKDSSGTAITRSKQYTGSLYIRTNATVNVRLKMKWLDSTGTEISETAGPITSTQDNNWARLYATGSAPFNATHVGLYVEEATQFEFPFRENLIPNPSFEVNTFDWQQPSNTTLARTTAVAAYGTASMSMTSDAAGEIAARYSYGTSGIPVVAGQTYTFSIFVRSAAVSRNARVFFQWFNNNTYLSGSAASDTSTIVGEWRRVSVTATAPATTNYAMPQITIQTPTGAGEVHYIDAALMEQVSSFNLMEYSGFNSGTTGWTGAGSNTNVSVSSDALSGRYSLRMSAVAAGTVLAEPQFPTFAFRIEPSTAYVGSVKFKANNIARSCRISLLWYDSAKLFISQTSGVNVTDSNNSWVTASVTGTSPVNAAYMTVQLAIDGLGAGEEHYADEVLVQPGSTVNAYVNSRYFDGSVGDAPYWNSTANASTSIDCPAIYVDAVMIEPVSRYNLMTNGLFLNGVSGWTINTCCNSSAQISHITNAGPIGDSGLTTAMQLNNQADTRIWNLFQGEISVPKSIVSGSQYTLSFWVRSLDGNAHTLGASILRGDAVQGVSIGSYTVDGNNWKKISLTFNGSGIVSTSAILYMTLPTNASFILQYAGFVLEPGGTAGLPINSSYFDGTTSGYSWTGTANDSTSRTNSSITIFDLSGNGNNGSLVTARTTTQLDRVPCFDFTENASSIPSGNTAGGAYEGIWFSSNMVPTTGNFTISTWIKNPQSAAGQSSTFSNAGSGDGYRLGIGKDGIYYLIGPTYQEGSISFLSTLDSTSWYNVCVVYSRTTLSIKLYLNGIIQGSVSIPSPQTAFTPSIPGIGSGNCCTPWQGKLSKFTVYARELTPAEIAQNFNALRSRYGI